MRLVTRSAAWVQWVKPKEYKIPPLIKVIGTRLQQHAFDYTPHNISRDGRDMLGGTSDKSLPFRSTDPRLLENKLSASNRHFSALIMKYSKRPNLAERMSQCLPLPLHRLPLATYPARGP